jgi:acetyl esterase/lipase
MDILLWPEGTVPLARGTASEDTPRLVAYPAAGVTAAPAVIIAPGGSYEEVNVDNEGEAVAGWLNSLGISAYVLYYRVKPYMHPCPLTDAQRAVRYLRYHSTSLHVDPNRIAMMGFSAGGHLSCTTATHADDGDSNAEDPIDRVSSRLNLLVLGYGSTSFMKREYTIGSQVNLIGENPPEELRRYYSNEFHVTEQMPPVFMWHTSNDRVQNSLLFALALKEKKIRFELHCYEYGNHGLSLAKDHPYIHTWTGHCEAWLKRNGF